MQEEKPIAIQLWNVTDLVPYEMNAKKHPPEQVEKLAKLIEKSGWTQPIVVWGNGEIIAGHGRRLAAIHLGMKKVPVLVRDDLSKAEADALRLADNRVTSTEYDQSMIQDELRRLSEELEGSNISLDDLGFDAKELDFSLADLGEIDGAMFTDDVGAAVENLQNENEASVGDVDAGAAPVGDALGFKRVTVVQSREIRGYMARIEAAVGSTGADALVEFLKKSLEGVE